MKQRVTLGERLHELIREVGREQQEIARELKIKRSTFNGYVNNNREPKMELIKVFADYFKVSVDYLIGYSENKTHFASHLSSELLEFISQPENENYVQMAKEIKDQHSKVENIFRKKVGSNDVL